RVLDAEPLEIVDADRVVTERTEQLRREVAPAGHRHELELAVVALALRVEDPLAAEDLRVLDDHVEQRLVVVHGAVDRDVEIELRVDDVALGEPPRDRAEIDELVAIDEPEPG